MGKTKRSHSSLYFGLVALWMLTVAAGLGMGAVSIPEWSLIVDLRLPRVALASIIGIGLSISGAALQALFSNPLCEPYTLGISSGAALGAVIGVSLGLDWTFVGLAGPSFIGALVFALFLFGISFRSRTTNLTLLLVGLMLGFLGTSLVSIWIILAQAQGLEGALTWLFGDLSRARTKGILPLGFGVLLLSFSLWKQWRSLDALLIGEEGAVSLGVDVSKARRSIILNTSILVALCVSAGGMIGFVGLIIPHFARRWVGALHFTLIPTCALMGAIALTIADCLSRTLARPYEIPVGLVTALVGAPLFLSMILRRREIL